MTASLVLAPDEFLRVRDLLYQRCGMTFDEDRRDFVARRVHERMRSVGAGAFRDYLGLLRRDASGEEMQRLINLITVNETYFFREEYQLRCLVRSLLGERTLGRPPGSTLRLWSMPCSTGEEPYSLAMYLLEHWPRVDDFDVEIFGSDIDTGALKAAERAVYDARSVSRLPPALLTKYFTPLADGSHRLCEGLRDSVAFAQVNLTDPASTAPYRDFDVIFCRNLLIYFDDAGRRRAAETFFEALRPGGFICLGHSESMGRISSSFLIRKFPEAIVYQRPTAQGGNP